MPTSQEDSAGQPTTPTSMVQIFAEEVGALPVLGFKKPSMYPTRVETNHAPP
ncbi:MAG TPA: hypothetical protein VII84_04330 [Acidimicrobiales bacterium]